MFRARSRDPRLGSLLVKHGRTGSHRLLGIEYGRKQLVLDLDLAAAFFRSALALGDDRGYSLPDVPHDVVQDVGVVGVRAVVVMGGRCIEAPRHVVPREHGVDSRHRQRVILVD
jgi:hypothetical protein